MNPIKLIRKLGKALRGGATFRDMFLGIFLGFAIGMIPGVNLTLVLLILLLLFLNANGALACLSIFVGKMLCLALAPVTFRIGYALIHNLGLVGLIRKASETPVVAMMDLHVYCLLGALPVIIVVGGALAWFVTRSVMKMRTGIAAAAGASGKVRKAGENKFIRFVMRVVFGKQKGKFADMADRKSPLIRKGRVIAALVVVAILVIVQYIFLDALVKAGLEKSIAQANGAEVNIDKIDLSLIGGRLVIEGLQVTDAARPTHNLFQAERIVSDTSLRDLLTRRLVVDLVECHAMRMDALRESPGEVYRRKAEPEKKPPSILDDLAGKLGKSAEYYEEVKKFNERLKKLREYLESDEPDTEATEADKDALARRAKALGYLRLSAKEYMAKSPTWVIRDIKVSRIELRPDLPTFTAEGKNLSSHPSLLPEKMELTARPDEEALKAFIAKTVGGKDKKDGLLRRILPGKKDADKEGEKPKEEDKKSVLDNLFGK